MGNEPYDKQEKSLDTATEFASRGTIGHRAMVDVSFSLKTELPVKAEAATAFLEALTDFIRHKTADIVRRREKE